MDATMLFLVAEGETPEAREERRQSVGESAGETFRSTLAGLFPEAAVTLTRPGDGEPPPLPLDGYDAVFLSGSPLHLWKDSTPGRRQVEFMRAVLGSGTPSFGSCAGLQVAAVAAGGTVRPRPDGHEAGFARRVTPTEAGRPHPLLAGRPDAFDAPSIHTDEVERLPDGATWLATNAVTAVQAAEIRLGPGVFWGVQYHPELTIGEIAAALRRQADAMVEHGLARDTATVSRHADLLDGLHREPERRDLAWLLGLDEEVTRPECRSRELTNFVNRLVRPTRSERGRD